MLAAVFIVMSCGAAAVGLLQNVMIYFMFPADVIRRATMDPNVPPVAAFLFQYVRVFFLCFFLASLATLAASIGLIRRREWGRKLFIAMMGLSIAWNIAGAVLQVIFLSGMSEMMPGASPEVANQFRVMQYGMMGFGIAFAAVLIALHAWIILRLSRESVRAEFAASKA